MNKDKPLELGEAILSDKAIQELTIKNKENRDLTTSLWFVQESKLDSTCTKVKPGIWLVIIHHYVFSYNGYIKPCWWVDDMILSSKTGDHHPVCWDCICINICVCTCNTCRYIYILCQSNTNDKNMGELILQNSHGEILHWINSPGDNVYPSTQLLVLY